MTCIISSSIMVCHGRLTRDSCFDGALSNKKKHILTCSPAYPLGAHRIVAAYPFTPLPLSCARRLPCHVLSPTAPCPIARAPVPITCTTRSLAVGPSPSSSRAPLTPPWPLGRTCSGTLGLPRPSQGTHEHGRCWWCLRAVARRRLLTRRPESTGPAFPSPRLHINV
jgi:hypothetical protein